MWSHISAEQPTRSVHITFCSIIIISLTHKVIIPSAGVAAGKLAVPDDAVRSINAAVFWGKGSGTVCLFY